jgi:hypothetical protein
LCLCLSPSPPRRGGIFVVLLPCRQVATSDRLDCAMTPFAQACLATCTAPLRCIKAVFQVCLSIAVLSCVATCMHALVHHGAAFGWKGLCLWHVVDVASLMSALRHWAVCSTSSFVRGVE